jgi:Restriction endonuclease S subunits
MLDIEVFEGGFKETELGPLPEEWEVVRLGEVGNYINGYAFKPSDWSKIGKPIIRIQNLNNPLASFNYYNGELDHKYLVKKGDILISWSASLGVYLWNGGDAWLNQHIFKVELTNQKVLKDYFYFALLYYFTSQAFANLHGSTMKHIVKSKFLNISIPLPPLEEQKAIAGILSTVQSAIEKTEKVINALKNLKKSMMKHLFTYGPVAEEEAEKVELKETEIGLIPKHWEVVRLGEVVKIIKGKKPKTLNESPSKNSLPYLTAEYFRYGVPKHFVDIEVEKDLPICKKEDVVLIWDGSKAGQVFTGLEGVLASTMVKIISTINNLDKLYLYCFLATKFDYLNSQTTGSTIPHVNKTTFFNLPLPLPPLEEQQKIAQILQSIDQRIEKEEKYKNALQNLFKSLLHNLMTGKIRVRVKSHGED